MKVALVMLALLTAPAVAPLASARVCDDAPYLPGALSGYYDMWNNVYRHYTCLAQRHIDGGGDGGAAVRVVLP